MEENISFFDKLLCVFLVAFFIFKDIKTSGGNMLATKIVLVGMVTYAASKISCTLKGSRCRLTVFLYSILSLVGMYTLANIAI